MVGNLFEIEVEGKNLWICKWDLSVMFNECVWKFKKVLDEILKKKNGKGIGKEGNICEMVIW